MTDDFRLDRIGSALREENPTVMRKLPGAFAVLGDVQWLPGYSVLLVDRAGISRLSDLTRPRRLEFLTSMDILGEAVEVACANIIPGYRRVNLEILGNTDDFLHAHVWPRYDWETPERVVKPVWLYPPDLWTLPTLQTQNNELREAIEQQLDRLTIPAAGSTS
jgi:diadenosine tetraphosphate (Ap4A) HIT family hydrolase